jgi:hypothetical protein
LRAGVRAASGPGVVETVLGIVAGSLEVGAVETRVDVGQDKFEALGAKVVSSPVADDTVSGCRRCLASSRLVRRYIVGSDLQVTVREGGVRKTVAELVDGSLVEAIEVAVIDEDALNKVVLGSTLAVVRRVDHIRGTVISASLAPGERSLSTGVDLAVEDVGDSVTGLLTGNTGPDDGSNVLMLVPGLDQDGADSVHDNNSVVTLRGDGVNKDVTVVPKSKVVAVALVAVESNVSLASISICENNACTANLGDTVCKSSLLGDSIVVDDALDRAIVAKNLSLDSLERSYEVREVSCKLVSKCKLLNGTRKLTSAAAPTHCEGTVVAAAVWTSVGSVWVLAGVRAEDSCELLIAREGQCAVVLEEDCAVGGHLSDSVCMIVADVNVVVDASVIYLGIRVKKAVGVLRPRREVGTIFKLAGVTADVVPGGNNTGYHVVEAELWDGAVKNGDGEVGSLSSESANEPFPFHGARVTYPV